MQCAWNLLLIYFSSGRSIAFSGRVCYPNPTLQTEGARGSYQQRWVWKWLISLRRAKAHPLSHCMACPRHSLVPQLLVASLPSEEKGRSALSQTRRSVVKGALGQVASEALSAHTPFIHSMSLNSYSVPVTYFHFTKKEAGRESLICQSLAASPSFESRTVQAHRIYFYTTVLWLCTV